MKRTGTVGFRRKIDIERHGHPEVVAIHNINDDINFINALC